MQCPDWLMWCNIYFPLDGGRAKEAEETESDPNAELHTQPIFTGSPQPGRQTDPGSGDTEAGAPGPGLCTQHKHRPHI